MSDDIKVWYVCALLDDKMSLRVRKTVFSKTYEAVCNFLFWNFSGSKWECAQQILSVSELDDRKPSQLVKHMYHCLGELDPSFLLKNIFIKSLLGYDQGALSPLKTNNQEILGKEACSAQQPQAKQEASDGEEKGLPAVHQFERMPFRTQHCEDFTDYRGKSTTLTRHSVLLSLQI